MKFLILIFILSVSSIISRNHMTSKNKRKFRANQTCRFYDKEHSSWYGNDIYYYQDEISTFNKNMDDLKPETIKEMVDQINKADPEERPKLIAKLYTGEFYYYIKWFILQGWFTKDKYQTEDERCSLINECVKYLDAFLSKELNYASISSEHGFLYHGGKFDNSKIKMGDYLVNLPFMSTTNVLGVALKFSKETMFKINLHSRLDNKIKSKKAKLIGVDVMNISNYVEESEYLLARNQYWKVVNVKTEIHPVKVLDKHDKTVWNNEDRTYTFITIEKVGKDMLEAFSVNLENVKVLT